MRIPRRTFLVIALAAVAVFFFVFLVYPMLYVFKCSVVTEGGQWTLAFFESAFSNEKLTESILNSFLVGIVVTVGTSLIALPMAIFLVRRQFPGKKILSSLILLPMILPPFVGAIGMKEMFTPHGSVNALLAKMSWGITWLLSGVGLVSEPWSMEPVNWLSEFGFWGVVIIEILHLYPIMYLSAAASLSSVDSSCEEAALNLGASRWNVFRRITFPLMLPGFFAGASIIFIWAFTDLGTPLILEFERVIPYQIFDKVRGGAMESDGYPLVIIVLVMTTLVFVLARWFIAGRLRDVATKGRTRAAPRAAGKWTSAMIIAFILGVTLVALIPHTAVLLNSITAPGQWQRTVFPTELSLEHYRELADEPMARSGIFNGLWYSGMAAAGVIVLGVLIAYLLTREKFRGKVVLDTTVMIPLAIPGIIIASGYLTGFTLTFLDPMQNPVPLLIISYVVRRIPYMTRAAIAGFQHVSISLEEASTNLGASRFTTLRRITMPLVAASLIGGAILTFIFSMFEVSQSLVLVQRQELYPISRVLYHLAKGLMNPSYRACAMGVVGMVILGTGLVVASRFLGRRMGEIFRV